MPPLIFSNVLTELNAWGKKRVILSQLSHSDYHVTSGFVGLEVFLTNRGRQSTAFQHNAYGANDANHPTLPVGVNGGRMSLRLHPLERNNTPLLVRCWTLAALLLCFTP